MYRRLELVAMLMFSGVSMLEMLELDMNPWRAFRGLVGGGDC